jgi:O-antigen/teichoic acid export membrane protein
MSNAKRTVIKNTSAMLVSQVITWTLTLVFSVAMRRILGPDASGELVIASSIWMIAGAFISFGMDMLLTKEIARDHTRAAGLLGTSYILRAAFYAISVVVIFAYTQMMRYPAHQAIVVQVVGLSALFFQLAQATKATHQGLETMEYISISDIAAKVINTGLGVTVLLLGYDQIAVAWALTASTLALWLIQLYFLVRRHRIVPRINRGQIVPMLRASLPYLATAFGMIAYSELAVIVLSMQVSTTEVGWYGAASQIFATLLFGAVVFTTVTFPTMARAHIASPDAMPEMLRRNLALILIISVPIGLGLFTVAPQLMVLLFGEAFAPSGQILQVLSLVLIFMYANVLFGQYFNSTDRQHVWTVVIVISATMIVPLNLMLVPLCQRVFGVGAIGGALSFLITEAGQFLAGWFLTPRGTLTWRTVRHCLLVVSAGLLMVGCVWFVRDLFILIPIVVGAIAYPVLAVLLGVVSRAEVAAISASARALLARVRGARTEPAS